MSRFSRSLFAIALGLCLVAGSARASQVVFGNLGDSGTGNVSGLSGTGVTASSWLAQGFTTGANSSLLEVDSITLGLRNPTLGIISASVSIWSDSGGEPGSSIFSSGSVSIPANTQGAKYTFSFNSATLSASQSYWVVFNSSGLIWSTATPGGPAPSERNGSGYSYLGTLTTANSGSSWGEPDLLGYAVSIQASEATPEPIPEPGTWAAAAVLIGLAGYVRWRRRAQAV